jgi:hypothetical protein
MSLGKLRVLWDALDDAERIELLLQLLQSLSEESLEALGEQLPRSTWATSRRDVSAMNDAAHRSHCWPAHRPDHASVVAALGGTLTELLAEFGMVGCLLIVGQRDGLPVLEAAAHGVEPEHLYCFLSMLVRLGEGLVRLEDRQTAGSPAAPDPDRPAAVIVAQLLSMGAPQRGARQVRTEEQTLDALRYAPGAPPPPGLSLLDEYREAVGWTGGRPTHQRCRAPEGLTQWRLLVDLAAWIFA